MRYLILLLFPFYTFSAVNVKRVTQQEFVLSYTAPQNVPCKIEVSQKDDFSELIENVNPTLFPGSNYDLSRAGKYVSGTYRELKIGLRRTLKGTDGIRYSQALFSEELYYVRISECIPTEIITVITGKQISRPNIDPLPIIEGEEGLEGYYNFPTLLNDRRQSFADPATGTRLKRLEMWEDLSGAQLSSRSLNIPISDTWIDPNNALVQDGLLATTTGTGILYISNGSVYTSNSYWAKQIIANLRADVQGGAIGDDAVMQMCLGRYINNIPVCFGDWKDIDLSTCSITDIQGECANIGNPLADTRNDPPNKYWWKNGEFGPEGWHSSLTFNWGFLIRKKIDSGHTIRIDSTNYLSTRNQALAPSNDTACSSKTIPGSNLVVCYNSDRLSHGIFMWAIDEETGESWRHGSLTMTNGVKGADQTTTLNALYFDPNNPLIGYTVSPITPYAVYKIEFTDNLTTWRTNSTIQAADPTVPATPAIIQQYTRMTPTGWSIGQQVTNFHPDYVGEWQTSSYVWEPQQYFGGRIVFRKMAIQDAGRWTAVFDTQAEPPVGCGNCIGKVIAATSSGVNANSKVQKGCISHGYNAVPYNDWTWIGGARQAIPGSTSYYAGSHRIQVKKVGCDPITEDCSIGPGENQFEVVGDFNYLDPTPSSFTEDLTKPIEVDDLIAYMKPGSLHTQIEVSGNESMEIIGINGNIITVRRGPDIQNSGWAISGKNIFPNPALTIPELSYLYLKCRTTALNNDNLGGGPWNFIADPYGKTIVKPGAPAEGLPYPPISTDEQILEVSSNYSTPRLMDFTGFAGHGTWTMDAKFGIDWRSCPSGIINCYAVQLGSTVDLINQPINHQVVYEAKYAGKGKEDSIGWQSHATRVQTRANSNRYKNLAFDVTPLEICQGAIGVSAEVGTNDVYQVTGTTVSRKHWFTLAFSNMFALRDISSPTAIIDDTQPWTYCIAEANDWCRVGSLAGNIYVNIPFKNTGSCTIGATEVNNFMIKYGHEQFGATIGNISGWNNGSIQMNIMQSDVTSQSLKMNTTFGYRPAFHGRFGNNRVLANGKWIIFHAQVHGAPVDMLAKVYLPKYGTNNSTQFEKLKLQLKKVPENTSYVQVVFGYEELDDLTTPQVDLYRCRTIRDDCVVTNALVDNDNPFEWNSLAFTGIPCSGGCTVEIPRDPGKITFIKYRFFDEFDFLLEERPAGIF